MRIKRDFERIYRDEQDPWGIGNADAERYITYRNLILARSGCRDSILDIGCGMGAFLAHFEDEFRELIGVDVSFEAVRRGQARFPFIKFVQGAADQQDLLLGEAKFSTIVFSDVICYFKEQGRRRSLEWIADHLAEEGLAFIAAWLPGGDYLTQAELRRLVARYFYIEEEFALPSNHCGFLARKRRRLVAITVDYETWQPIPPGRQIDWRQDIFLPTNRLLEVCRDADVRLTIMAEVGEYFWLKENDPTVAAIMREQWQTAMASGHDVQMHLHPNWLPGSGAIRLGSEWNWDWTKASANDYPGDLVQLIEQCKIELESILRPANPNYRVQCYRAGAYRVQPFHRLYGALRDNGILCDSSVYAGGVSAERGYDFSLAYSEHQPYFANAYDPQLKAPPAESAVVELPVFTYKRGMRWFLDNDEGARIAEHFQSFLQSRHNRASTEHHRRSMALKKRLNQLYFHTRQLIPGINRIASERLLNLLNNYLPPPQLRHDYFVMIGHTKANLQFDQIAANLARLKQLGAEFVTLSSMAAMAREELSSGIHKSPAEEAEYQVQREAPAILGENRNEAQSYRLQEMIPWDRYHVLDFGCGAGYWSARIARLFPWMQVVGVDCGTRFIAKANQKYRMDRVQFMVADFLNLSFADETFDCVYADNTLEHAFDVDGTLREIFRVLTRGGVLVAAIPSDARNPKNVCDNHTWKTAPHEVILRLENIGFHNVSLEEINVCKCCGMSPYSPSRNRMMYLKGWKRDGSARQLDRACEAMNWIYHHLAPNVSSESADPVAILAGRGAFCRGYSIALGKLLEREGFRVRWITMCARDHVKGRGTLKVDSHEIVEAELDGQKMVLDPMTNRILPFSFEELVRSPTLATARPDVDERYRHREYHLYDSEYWFSRIFKYAVRSTVKAPLLTALNKVGIKCDGLRWKRVPRRTA